jgi:phosphoserine phosphatase
MSDSTLLGVAAFDFDGTLVPGDSFLPFLIRVRGARLLAAHFGASTLSMLVAGGFKLDRDASKADLVARLLTGLPAAIIQREGESPYTWSLSAGSSGSTPCWRRVWRWARTAGSPVGSWARTAEAGRRRPGSANG